MPIKPGFRLSRRAVLRGARGIAIGLPWLEIMSGRRLARAVAAPAARFLAVYQPGGTVLARWRPTGTETDFVLSPILAPFEPVKSKLLIPDGLDMKSAVGEQRQSGIIAWLTGSVQAPGYGYSKDGPSIDQALAPRLSAGKRKASLQMAVRWGTGKSHGLTSPINIANFENALPYSPIPPAIDPVTIWQDLFGALPAGDPGAAWDKSILDFVDRRYARLAARLGAADRQRLDQHLTRLRDLETRVATSAHCTRPVLVDTSDYNPKSGLNSADNGSIKDLPTDAAIPKVGKLMMDMMVMAMACDITNVGTLQWSDTEAKHTFPWLGLPETYAFYQNDGGYRPAECEKIATWYSGQHAYLLQEMARMDMGGHSLLDESIVFFGSERQDPATYSKADMPFLLAGGGGGLRTGRWVRYNHQSHNELLVAILHLCGDTRATFGTLQYSTGTLGGLT
jgi:Protein of unknown function (DUF1552)